MNQNENERLRKDNKSLRIFVLFVIFMLGSSSIYLLYQLDKEEVETELYSELFFETVESCTQIVENYNLILERWDELNETSKKEVMLYLKISENILKDG